MAVREGLLVLLAERPRHGYELKTELERRTGSLWSLNTGQVYTTLDRLQRDGLVEPADDVEVGNDARRRAYRLTTQGEKTDAQEVHREALKTDDQGRAVFGWKAEKDGSYEVRFEARDAWEQLVAGVERTWVAGDGAGSGVFHDRHVMLAPQQTTYRIGDTAKVLGGA